MACYSSLEQPGSFDLPIDPHEPVYCMCRQVAFGNMIACDNPQVTIGSLLCFAYDFVYDFP